jgi:hypothetical protein
MAIQACRRKLVVPVVALVLVGSSFLWVWTSGIYYRTLPTPAFAIRLPFVLLQACANDEGVHLLAIKERANQLPAIQFERASYLGNAGYHHGCVVNILGLVMAVLPTEYCGGDYVVSPHTALVLPYWLLIVGAGCLLVVLTPAVTWIRRYCRPSKVSGGAATLVCLLFVMLNVVPSAWRPGAAIEPQTIHEWVTLTLEPHTTHSEIMLVYGFPFPCYRKGIINGQSVNLFYGASVGWEPHKAMENICVAVLTAFGVVLAIELLRHWVTGQQTAPPNKSLNPTGNKPAS